MTSVVYHAAASPIFGFSMIEELAGRGYKLCPGMLYPILHGLEMRGYLRSNERRLGRTARRMYQITPSGRRALEAAKSKVCEFLNARRAARRASRDSAE